MAQERARRASGTTLLVDAGDTIQGSPLAYDDAEVDPVTEGSVHPMAGAMNARLRRRRPGQPGRRHLGQANVEGTLPFSGIVEQAALFVPQMKAGGADVWS